MKDRYDIQTKNGLSSKEILLTVAYIRKGKGKVIQGYEQHKYCSSNNIDINTFQEFYTQWLSLTNSSGFPLKF